MATSQATSAKTISLLPHLKQRAFQHAIRSFNHTDLTTRAGHERIVRDVARAYADYERRMLPLNARRIDRSRVEAIVRVALRDIVAACA